MPRRVAKPDVEHNTLTLLESYERHLRAEKKATGTILNRRTAVEGFTRFCESEGVADPVTATRGEVEAWLDTLNSRLAPATVRTRHVALRAFFDWLAAEDEIERSPFGPKGARRIEPPELPESPKDVATAEEMLKVFEHLDKGKRWRDAVIVAVLYDTGMRATELATCLSAQVNLEVGIIELPHTKAKRVRHVVLSSPTIDYIDRYWRRYKPRTAEEKRDRRPTYLVNGTRGAMTRSGIYQVVRALFEEVGIDQRIIGAHDMRHTAASHVAEAGLVGESDAMTTFGWARPDMWRHYTQQARAKASLEAMRKASPVARLFEGKGKRR